MDFPNSDTWIRIRHNGEIVLLGVELHALRKVSPVWWKMSVIPSLQQPGTRRGPPISTTALTGRSSAVPDAPPSTPQIKTSTQTVKLDFTNVNSAALLLLLAIAHSCPDLVPTKLDYRSLLNVAHLCYRFQCVHLVGPWLSGWINNDNIASLLSREVTSLTIALVFGRRELFETLSTYQASVASVNSGGEYLDPHGLSLQQVGNPLPSGIVDSMLILRSQTIAKLLDIVNDAIDTLAMILPNNDLDDGSRLAALVIELQDAGLMPREIADDAIQTSRTVAANIRISAVELAAKIKGLTLLQEHLQHDPFYGDGWLNIQVDALSCGPSDPWFDIYAESLMAEYGEDLHVHWWWWWMEGKALELAMPCPALESHYAYMQWQMKKLGR